MPATIENNPTPFERGMEAARNGFDIGANPYRREDQWDSQQSWYAGYASYQRRTAPHHHGQRS